MIVQSEYAVLANADIYMYLYHTSVLILYLCSVCFQKLFAIFVLKLTHFAHFAKITFLRLGLSAPNTSRVPKSKITLGINWANALQVIFRIYYVLLLGFSAPIRLGQ